MIGTSKETRARNVSILWFSPWVLIVIFIVWHLSAPGMMHYKARLAWQRDRSSLRASYLAMWSAEQHGDMGQFFMEEQRADGALITLEEDLKKLSGADDYAIKAAFLEGGRTCADASFSLTPPSSKPSEYCLNLINGPEP